MLQVQVQGAHATRRALLFGGSDLLGLWRGISGFGAGLGIGGSSTRTTAAFKYQSVFAHTGAHAADFETNSLRVVLKDEHIVVVDKPCGMMSVPGRQVQALADGSVPRRTAQWEAAIRAAHASAESHTPPLSTPLSAPARAVLAALVSVPNVAGVPRKQQRFYTYLRRVLRIHDSDVHVSVWERVCSHDTALHQRKLQDIPPHLVSADDLVRASVPGPILHVHRLDMETAGLLLFARSEEACAVRCEQFRQRTVKKTYVAEVIGSVCPTLQSVDVALRASPTRPLQQVDIDVDTGTGNDRKSGEGGGSGSSSGSSNGNGKPAHTLVKILENRPASTLVQLQPTTGRTHQLRVHMAHSGHCILGDTLYHTDESLAASDYLRLHARVLEFQHPVSGETIVVESDSCSFL